MADKPEEVKKKTIDKETFDKINWYKFYRESKVSFSGNIVTGLFVSLVIIFLETVNFYLKSTGKAIFQNNGILLAIESVLLFIFLLIYFKKFKKELENTYLPVFVSNNLMGTIIKKPEIVKTKNGKEYVITQINDSVNLEEKNKG